MSHHEGMQLSHLSSVHCPGLGSIEKGGQHDCMVYIAFNFTIYDTCMLTDHLLLRLVSPRVVLDQKRVWDSWLYNVVDICICVLFVR